MRLVQRQPLGSQQKQVRSRLSDAHFVAGRDRVESVKEAGRAKMG